MQPFFIKSMVTLLALLSAVIGIATMFELYGRTEKKQNSELLRKIHRINGIFFIALTLFISSACLAFIMKTGTEPSSRGMFHSVFALAVLALLCFKAGVTTFYRQYYARLQTAGLMLAFFVFGTIGTSAGYYLLITKFGTHNAAVRASKTGEDGIGLHASVRTDPAVISRGRELYESKCYFCHDAYSSRQGTGPGHKGILKNRDLPTSRKPATPDNIAEQLRRPFRDMPLFSYLTDEEVSELIAYLNTL